MKLRILNRKGFFFTIIVLFLVILLLLISFQYRQEMTKDAVKTRILTADNFIKGVERDAKRAMYISGYRAMVAMMDFIATNGSYINPSQAGTTVEEVFADALYNGTLRNSLHYSGADPLLENTTIVNWSQTAIFLSKAVGLDISFAPLDPNGFIVAQHDPWNIVLSVLVNYNITDNISGVSWRRDSRINASIPIVDTFEDPLYLKEFGKGCTNKIFVINYTKLATFSGSCNTENLSAFLTRPWTGSMYISSDRAPSYLNRLRGLKYTPDPNGIESLIDTRDLSSCQSVGNHSVVDFKYVHGDSKAYHIIGMSWVKFDDSDKNKYNATGMNLIDNDCFALD